MTKIQFDKFNMLVLPNKQKPSNYRLFLVSYNCTYCSTCKEAQKGPGTTNLWRQRLAGFPGHIQQAVTMPGMQPTV